MIIKKSSVFFFIGLSSVLLLLIVVSPNLFPNEASAKEDDEKNKIKNWYYSMDVNDNWVFEEYAPSSPGTKFLGFGIKAGAYAVPVEDYDNYINDVKDYVTIMIEQDQDFGVKNAPLSMYVTHMKNTRSASVLNETSVQLDGENAVMVNYVGTGTFVGSKFIQIYTMHNDKPYLISYLGYGDKFNNKLGEFEEMLTSFKWEE